MKRSEINRAQRELEAMCEKYRCYLPPFCHFTPEQWQEKGHEYDEVRDCMLGWDITDFGLGNFDKVGFSRITIRNGCRTKPEQYPKVYAEKLLYLKEGQMAANHFHWYKTEDIINRGSGYCLIRVYNSLPDEGIDYESDVHTGGSVANTGLALKLLSNEVQLMGKIGRDAFGTMVKSVMTSYGVDGLIEDAGSATSYSVVLALPGCDRIFLHDPGANDSFSA